MDARTPLRNNSFIHTCLGRSFLDASDNKIQDPSSRPCSGKGLKELTPGFRGQELIKPVISKKLAYAPSALALLAPHLICRGPVAQFGGGEPPRDRNSSELFA